VKVDLGTFACSGVRAFLGGDIAAGVQAALGRYVERMVCAEHAGRDELESMWKAIPLVSEDRPPRTGVAVELALDPALEAALEREARESGGMSMDQVASYAVLAYLVELDRAGDPDARHFAPI
jgi:hypothetical protein